MNYIEKYLMEGEHIVFIPELHIALYWRPLIWAIIGIGMMAIPTEGTMLQIQLLGCFVLIVISIIKCINAYGGKQYILTNKRIIAKQGIIQRHSLELLLRKCEGVEIHQSISGRIFNYGTVLVTTGEATNCFEYIKDPIRFSNAINQMTDTLKCY